MYHDDRRIKIMNKFLKAFNGSPVICKSLRWIEIYIKVLYWFIEITGSGFMLFFCFLGMLRGYNVFTVSL